MKKFTTKIWRKLLVWLWYLGDGLDNLGDLLDKVAMKIKMFTHDKYGWKK